MPNTVLRTHLDDTVGLLIVILLILFTAFFVAAEFAIVKIRATRLDELIKLGNKRAAASKKIIDDLNGYLSTTQLGISVTALVLGWIGEPAVAHLFSPLFHWFGINGTFAHTLSVVSGFILITFASVVLGELAPKAIAIHKAEQITLLIAYPLMWIHRLLFPFVWLLNTVSNSVVHMLGIRPDGQHDQALSEGELRLTLADSYKSGEITQGELRYMTRIFDFDDRTAREIMVPRTEIVCLYKEDSAADSLQTIIHNGKFTRFPVVEEDKDHVIGLINIKDMFHDVLNKELQPLEQYIRPILSVLETTPIRMLLERMQKESIHMAILTDEYGGTSGLVTVEDILEEIVGEIRDEYDEGEEPPMKRISNDQVIVDGKLLISHINQLFQTNIEEEGIDTIGGWMLSENPNITVGTIINYDQLSFEVKEMEAHQIRKILITRKKTFPEHL